MRRNKTIWLRRIIIICGIASCIAGATILIIPLFISEDFVQQKVAQTVKDRFEYVKGVGPVSFQRPNRFTIGHLTLQRQEQNEDSPIVMENIKGALSLFPLLREKIIVKKLSIQRINYENRLLIKDLATDSLSFSDGIVSACMRLNINEGPTTLKGMVNFRRQEPAFDLTFEAKDVHITEDIPILEFLPLFTVKGGELGGVLSIAGSLQGKGMGRDIVNEKLIAHATIGVRDGYIRGNKLLSAILEILGEKDRYSFDSMESVIQIKDGKVYTQKMEMQGPLMSLNASGMAEFKGSISYDAVVRFNQEHMGKDVKKIAGLVLKHNELPIEIRGTTQDPRVAVKLDKGSLENVLKGLVNDFLRSSKEKRKKD